MVPPALSTSGPPPVRKVPDKLPPPAMVPIKAPDLPPEDAEALAAAAFADKPAEPEVVVNETIKFECEYCGFALEVSADMGGKRTQCSDCRRITRIPEAVKREAKEWHRAAQTQAEETAAEAAKEGAWGTANIKATDTKALVEAGILERETEPLTRMQVITWWSLRGLGGAVVVTLLVVGVVQLMSWWSRRKQERLFKEGFAAAAEDKVSPQGQAVLHIAAGDYRRRQARPREDKKRGSATEARTEFTEAYKLLTVEARATLTPERLADRDLGLTRLAMAEIELGGDGDAVTQELREKWDDVQRSLHAALSAIASPEAKAMALRTVCRRLMARKQGKRVLALALQITEPSGAEREDRFAKAEILAQVGLEFLNKDRELAEEAARHLTAFGAKAGDPPPPQPAVVALLTTLSKTVPAPPRTFAAPLLKAKMNPQEEAQAEREREAVTIGEVEALARLGNVDEARRRAEGLAPVGRLQALVGLAEAMHDSNPGDRTDLDSACKFAAGLRPFAERLRDKRFLDPDQQRQQELDRVRLDWALLRLIDLAVGAGLESDALNGVPAVISPDLRGAVSSWCFGASWRDRRLRSRNRSPTQWMRRLCVEGSPGSNWLV